MYIDLKYISKEYAHALLRIRKQSVSGA